MRLSHSAVIPGDKSHYVMSMSVCENIVFPESDPFSLPKPKPMICRYSLISRIESEMAKVMQSIVYRHCFEVDHI